MKLSLTAGVLAVILSPQWSAEAFVTPPSKGNDCVIPHKLQTSRELSFPPIVVNSNDLQKCKSTASTTALQMGLGSFIKKKVMRRGDDDDNKNKKNKKSVLGKREAIGKGKSSASSSTKSSMPEVNPLPTPLPSPTPAKTTATPKKKSVTDKRAAVKASTPLRKSTSSSSSVASSKTVPKDSFDKYRVQGTETAQDRINRVKSGKMTDQEKQAFLRTALSTTKTTSSRAPLRQEIPQGDLSEDSTKKKGNASPFPTDSLLRNFARGKGKEEMGVGSHAAPPIEMDSDRKKREYFEMVTNPNRFKALAPNVVGGGDGTSSARTASDLDDEIDQLQKEIEEAKTMSGGNVSVSSSDDSLGSRLEAGAYAAEQRTRELREKEEALRRKQEERLLELQRERSEQMAQREAEALAKKREQEELSQRAEAEKRTAEQQRLKELQQKQDEYWASKLKSQKEQQLHELSEEEEQEEARREAEAEMYRQEQEQLEQEAEAERIRIREEERQREDPHEGEILKEAEEERLRIQNQNFNTIAQSASKISGRPTLDSLNDVRSDASLSGFLNKSRNQEPATPKDAMMEQLRSMNSPLPSPSPAPRVEPSTPSVFQQNIASPPPPAPRPLGVVPQQARPAGGTGPSIRDMLSKSNNYDDDEPAPAPPVRQQAPFEPQKKRVVRQQVPLDSLDEDEEFEAFARNGPNKGMSIADAMKASKADDGDPDERGAQEKRAKMWGIDMSKFSDE